MPRFVRSDERKLRQILINLLDNAIKYTDTGTVALKMTWADHHDSPELACTVTDSGIGMAPEETDHIFEAFTTSSKKRVGCEGTGLGLAISRQFARLIGGDIEVRSQPREARPSPCGWPMAPGGCRCHAPVRLESAGVRSRFRPGGQADSHRRRRGEQPCDSL